MKIRDALNNINANLGYIKIIKIGENNMADEKMLDTFTAHELVDLMEKESKGVWRIGEYWNILYNG